MFVLIKTLSPVALPSEAGGRAVPRGGDTRMKFLKNVAEFRKHTGQTRSESGSCD